MTLYDTARAPNLRRVRIPDMTGLVGLGFVKASRPATPDALAHQRRRAKLCARPSAKA